MGEIERLEIGTGHEATLDGMQASAGKYHKRESFVLVASVKVSFQPLASGDGPELSYGYPQNCGYTPTGSIRSVCMHLSTC
ncbi:hypothetical protein PSCICJ_19790 [Pseudomonas cichorii]|nr:hypothetical protein PSCICJ_19790 [Pseudomonas cichorii]